jgi:hypothetical protein
VELTLTAKWCTACGPERYTRYAEPTPGGAACVGSSTLCADGDGAASCPVFANVEVSVAQLGAAYNRLVAPGQSLTLDAVTISDLPGAGVVTGSLSAGADGGLLRDPPTFRPLGGARPPPSGSAPAATSCTRRLIGPSRTA